MYYLTNNIGQNNQQRMDTFGMCWLQNSMTTKLSGLCVVFAEGIHVYGYRPT